MSRDLDEQLKEMGPEYRAVVARLRAGREIAFGQAAERPASGVRRALPWLIAASVLVGLGVAWMCGGRPEAAREASPRAYTVRVTDAAREYTLAVLRNDEAVKEMIATQNPDGSWKNDFLTRRNAEALRLCKDPKAQEAYKRAIRNLRAKGIL